MLFEILFRHVKLSKNYTQEFANDVAMLECFLVSGFEFCCLESFLSFVSSFNVLLRKYDLKAYDYASDVGGIYEMIKRHNIVSQEVKIEMLENIIIINERCVKDSLLIDNHYINSCTYLNSENSQDKKKKNVLKTFIDKFKLFECDSKAKCEPGTSQTINLINNNFNFSGCVNKGAYRPRKKRIAIQKKHRSVNICLNEDESDRLSTSSNKKPSSDCNSGLKRRSEEMLCKKRRHTDTIYLLKMNELLLKTKPELLNFSKIYNNELEIETGKIEHQIMIKHFPNMYTNIENFYKFIYMKNCKSSKSYDSISLTTKDITESSSMGVEEREVELVPLNSEVHTNKEPVSKALKKVWQPEADQTEMIGKLIERIKSQFSTHEESLTEEFILECFMNNGHNEAKLIEHLSQVYVKHIITINIEG